MVRATPGPVAVAGDSAGGYLVALVAQTEPVLAQALIYPATDPALDTPSAVQNATGRYLETEAMRWYWQHLLGDGAHDPLQATAGMPPAYVVTAGFDPLRDEGRVADGVPDTAVDLRRAAPTRTSSGATCRATG